MIDARGWTVKSILLFREWEGEKQVSQVDLVDILLIFHAAAFVVHSYRPCLP